MANKDSKWKPTRFIPLLSGVEILEGYHKKGVRFNKKEFDKDIIISKVRVDIIIIKMMKYGKGNCE